MEPKMTPKWSLNHQKVVPEGDLEAITLNFWFSMPLSSRFGVFASLTPSIFATFSMKSGSGGRLWRDLEKRCQKAAKKTEKCSKWNSFLKGGGFGNLVFSFQGAFWGSLARLLLPGASPDAKMSPKWNPRNSKWSQKALKNR